MRGWARSHGCQGKEGAVIGKLVKVGLEENEQEVEEGKGPSRAASWRRALAAEETKRCEAASLTGSGYSRRPGWGS